jgi:hypothetical protein
MPVQVCSSSQGRKQTNKQTNQKPQTKTRKNPEEKEFKSNICQMPYFSKAIT